SSGEAKVDSGFRACEKISAGIAHSICHPGESRYRIHTFSFVMAGLDPAILSAPQIDGWARMRCDGIARRRFGEKRMAGSSPAMTNENV
ncbi:MAG: hypothetical protein M3N38_01585, partial [Pseudomonadota bacterium]|nr:hypothetical protein [Pseudomonadota bacterium]